jgi:hypothetical protein
MRVTKVPSTNRATRSSLISARRWGDIAASPRRRE